MARLMAILSTILAIFAYSLRVESAPDYVDLGGQALSEESLLHHEVEEHYQIESNSGTISLKVENSGEERQTSNEEGNVQKILLTDDHSHGVKKLLKNYPNVDTNLNSKPDNGQSPLKSSILIKHIKDSVGSTEKEIKIEGTKKSVKISKTPEPSTDTENNSIDGHESDKENTNDESEAGTDSSENISDNVNERDGRIVNKRGQYRNKRPGPNRVSGSRPINVETFHHSSPSSSFQSSSIPPSFQSAGSSIPPSFHSTGLQSFSSSLSSFPGSYVSERTDISITLVEIIPLILIFLFKLFFF